MNDASLFYLHLKEFMRVHGITDDLPSRRRKLQAEVNELEEAVSSGNKTEIIKEACDVAIIAFHIILICGGSPIWQMFLKLQEVAARPEYRARAERIREAGTL